MGGADEICTDKTGTLTSGKMSLIECWVNNETYKTEEVLANTSQSQIRDFMQAFIYNCTSSFITNEHNKQVSVGNPTECAIANALKDNWMLEAIDEQ